MDMFSLTVKDKTTTVPVSYNTWNEKKEKGEEEEGEANEEEEGEAKTWYETMSIPTVIEHGGMLYRLRLPGANNRLDKRLTIRLGDPTSVSYVPGKFEPASTGAEYIFDSADPDEFRIATPREKATHVYIPPHKHAWAFNHKVPNIINYGKLQ